MSIIQDNVIDGLGYIKEENVVQLYIKDVLTFDDEDAHLELLNKKLANYLSFIVSGEIDEYVEAKDYDKEIIINFISEPSLNVKEFLNYYYESFKSNKITLKWKITSLKS